MMNFATDGRPMPLVTPTTQPFFEATARGELALQRCPRDGVFSYPRSHCPHCLGDDWKWETLSGKGSVHTFTVDRVGHDPAMVGHLPLAIAIVELEEGARMVGNVIDCDAQSVRVGMKVEASFETLEAAEGGDRVTVVRFRPSSN